MSDEVEDTNNKKTTFVDSTKSVTEYINKEDWRIKANANTGYSAAGLVNNLAGKLVANFWLDEVYTAEEGDAHRVGKYHIHDLDSPCAYCCGHDLQKLLNEGFNGITDRVGSRPPKHIREALQQMANFIGILQSEWAGAQAFSSFDTYLAPHLFFDSVYNNMSYDELKKAVRNFVYNLNVPSRWGQCVPISYQALKADGTWAFYNELHEGDYIMVIDSKTKKLSVDKLKRVNLYPCPSMIDSWYILNGEHAGKHIGVTRNHRMLFKNGEDLALKGSSEFDKHEVIQIPAFDNKKCEWEECSDFISVQRTDGIPFGDGTDPAMVWCPTTDTGTFVCRTPFDFVFGTGNSPFSNVTIDMVVPKDLAERPPVRGDDSFFHSIYKEKFENEEAAENDSKWQLLVQKLRERIGDYDSDDETILHSPTYKHFQEEIELIDRAFYEVLNEGDVNGLPFTFPIPTVNITEDFKWDSPTANLIFDNAAKYGSSYFQNFIGSQYKRDENGKLVPNESAYKPSDVRSMCCRLQLDKSVLRKRGGGLFGSDAQTGCYDEKTEVLTSTGWKHFKDLKLSDKLYTLTPDRKIELHHPSKIFAYDWDGDLLHFKNRTVDLLVTPNHNMAITQSNGTVKLTQAQDIRGRIDLPVRGSWESDNANDEYFIIPSTEHNGERTRVCEEVRVKMSTWLKFLALFISEGSVSGSKSGNAEETNHYNISFVQNIHGNVAVMDEVMNEMPFNVCRYEKEDGVVRWVINNKQLWEAMRYQGNSYQKHVPQYVFGLSKKNLQLFYEYLMLGDGYVSMKQRKAVYYTTSKRLADDMQHIAMLLGHGSRIIIDNRPRRKKYYINQREIKRREDVTHYEIYIHFSENRAAHHRDITKRHYKGKVYCAEVPNHVLFVRRNGKVVWCGNSIGVVTLNMARLGYVHKGDKEGLFKEIAELMDMGKSTLEKKRVWVKKLNERGLYQYTKRYVRTFDTYFSTIGVNGMQELIRNFTNDEYDITDPRGQKFAEEILAFMRARLMQYQEETGNLYNLEATPAEGACYRFAKEDQKRYPDIIQAGTKERPYYTNSSQLPVNFTDDVFAALDLQDNLQTSYTGGTVFHVYLNERVPNAEACKNLVRKILTNYRLPYISITPTFSTCPIHGYISGEYEFCPHCDKEIMKRHSEEIGLNE